MDVLSIPFHRWLGLERAEPPFLLQLRAGPDHANHLGTIHAAVLIALAEASSGLFLQQHAGDGTEQIGVEVVPVIRRMSAKFHQPASGVVRARCLLEPTELAMLRAEWKSKGRAQVTLPMQVLDEKEAVVLSVSYEWFIRYLSPEC